MVEAETEGGGYPWPDRRSIPRLMANVVELACRAPSLHNSQPWHWIAEDGSCRLFLEPHRVPHATDLSGREAVISCGARARPPPGGRRGRRLEGRTSRVFPTPTTSTTWPPSTSTRPSSSPTPTGPAPTRSCTRRTDRLPFAAPPELGRSSSRCCAMPSTPSWQRCTCCPTRRVPQLAEASRLTESLRRYDASYHAELHWWTAPFEIADGVPYSSLASAAERDRVDVARSFPGR